MPVSWGAHSPPFLQAGEGTFFLSQWNLSIPRASFWQQAHGMCVQRPFPHRQHTDLGKGQALFPKTTITPSKNLSYINSFLSTLPATLKPWPPLITMNPPWNPKEAIKTVGSWAKTPRHPQAVVGGRQMGHWHPEPSTLGLLFSFVILCDKGALPHPASCTVKLHQGPAPQHLHVGGSTHPLSLPLFTRRLLNLWSWGKVRGDFVLHSQIVYHFWPVFIIHIYHILDNTHLSLKEMEMFFINILQVSISGWVTETLKNSLKRGTNCMIWFLGSL